ncbi:hypothetical protein MJO10_28865, partial [Salmonella enterica subsp. enterica serovar Anatum]|nr:hypothetical protein [Salmonella enterica subsp. enterica serovar Anatum]
GIVFGEPKTDIDKIRTWKEKVITQLTGGLAGMAKGRKVKVVNVLSPPSSGHVSFAGIDYPLLPLNHQTPLVFQWFERNPDRFGQN